MHVKIYVNFSISPNYTNQKFILIILTSQSWISYSLNVKNEDELCIYLICKSNSSLHTDQINRSSLILLQKTFLYAIPVYFYVSVHMVNKSG